MFSLRQFSSDRFGVVDAAAPHAAAGFDQRRPQAGIVREAWMRLEIGSEGSLQKFALALVAGELAVPVAYQVDRSGQPSAIDHNLDQVPIQHLPNGTTGE